ncbi:LacI family DNA-binding transcriptional regulator [Pseudochelatococcus sp. B33]
MRDSDPSVTILDVAELAGVSATTVSNVVTGKYSKMSPETRLRVEEAIAKLKYRPNIGARALRHSANFAVGLIIVDTSPEFLMHPAHAHIVSGLSNGLNSEGYSIVLQGVMQRNLASALSIQNRSTDAICAILSGPYEERMHDIKVLQSVGQPIVLFHERLQRIPADMLIVRADEYGGAETLAQHMIDNGCERLALLVPSTDWPANSERVSGVKSVAKNAGLPQPPIIHCGDGRFEATQKAVAAYIEQNELPDAFMAMQDQIGIAAMLYLKSIGIRVPEDIKITGFNAFEFWKYTEPVLTTIRSPAYELGHMAAQHIISRLKTGSFSAQEIVAAVQMVEGGTTVCTPKKGPQSKRRKGSLSKERDLA